MVASERPEDFGWSVLLVDDADDIRTLVRLVLERTGRLRVVGEAANGREAIDLVATLRPDIVLLDLNMPVMDGSEALPLILEASPTTKVVIYSGIENDLIGHRLSLASGYIVKGATADEMIDEIISILESGEGLSL